MQRPYDFEVAVLICWRKRDLAGRLSMVIWWSPPPKRTHSKVRNVDTALRQPRFKSWVP